MKARFLKKSVLGLAAAGVLLGAAACGGSSGSGDASGKVTLAIGGQSAVVYLPVTLAERLGYYKDAGLDVHLVNFNGGSKAIEAMLGGSADVAASSYDHAVQLQTKKQSVEGFVNYMNLPSMVLAVSPKYASDIKTVADLKGKHVGVSAPGSSTQFFLDRLLANAGLHNNDVSVVGIGVGTTAVAQVERGSVAAAVIAEPDVSVIKKHAGGSLTLLADTRTKQGTQQTIGVSSYPFTCLLAQSSWLKAHPQDAKKLAQAITRTLDWIRQHSAQEIAAKMPADFAGGQPDIYAQAIKNTMPAMDTDGTIDPAGAQAVLDLLKQGGAITTSVDLATTYTNRYMK